MKIFYTIEYNNIRGLWVVYKNIEGDYSFNFFGMYEGTKKECENELKRIINEQRRF